VAATEALPSIDFMLEWLRDLFKDISFEENTRALSKSILD